MNLPRFPSTLLAPFFIKILVALAVVVITFHALSLHPGIRNATHFNHSPSPHLQLPKGGNCLPQNSSDILNDLKAWQSSCGLPKEHHPTQWRVTTATAHFGKVEEHYQKALQTHVLHTMLHQTKLEVMCTPIIDSLWNKPAFLLSMLLGEMLKKPEERTEWIFWVDRDTIVLDECRPAASFLPPRPLDAGDKAREQIGDDDVQLIVTNDWNGLNNGVFFVRVGQWAVELFTAILAFRYYRPDVKLTFTEQSAMEIVMREPRFNKSVQIVPQTWFNTYPGGNASTFLDRDDQGGLADYQVRRGDFLIHFAGVPNRDRSLNDWTDMLGRMPKVWEEWRIQRNATAGIAAFWKKMESEKTDSSSLEE